VGVHAARDVSDSEPWSPASIRRNGALFRLLYAGGLRVSEIAALMMEPGHLDALVAILA
jgi:site-specific recombinase XerD